MTTQTTRKKTKARRAKKNVAPELLTPAAVVELAIIRDVDEKSVERKIQYHAEHGKVDAVRILTANGRRFYALTFETAVEWLEAHGYPIRGDEATGALD